MGRLEGARAHVASAEMLGDADVPPKVTPYLLRRTDDMCPRRLDLEYRAETGNRDPVNRARVRGAFLEAARTAHTLGTNLSPDWRPGPGLTPEEVTVFEQAVHWYCRLFGDRTVTLDDHDLDRPSEVDGLDVRIGGWVDVTVTGTDGRKELRQLDFWGRRPPEKLLDDWTVALALVRLEPWLGTEPVRVSYSDLLHGLRTETEIEPVAAVEAARTALTARVDALRARIAGSEPAPEPGADCGTCAFHKGCPEFPGAMAVGGAMRKASLLPGVISLTPSAVEAWHRCPRLWRAQYLLSIPASDDAAPAVHGQQVHDLLRLLHQQGPCDDPTRIDDVVAAHGASARVHGELVDHARRCPLGARSFGHEFTRGRLHAKWPNFIASARIDAAWIHDGILDVRDYKTGGVSSHRVAEDRRARLQAWVMAPLADQLGLRLRLRYEHLAAEIVDDPEEWEPDADDLDTVGAELVALVKTLRAETDWAGVSDPAVCGYCRYRSICPDSATPGLAAWPRVDDDDEETDTS